MTECVILFRFPFNGRIRSINDDDDIAVFPNMDAAITCADGHPLLQRCDYQIVELDEL